MDWYQTDERFLVIVAGTGTGKSLLPMVTQRALEKNVDICVSTLRLQNQIQVAYEFANLLKGRDNYKCLIADEPVSRAPCQVGFQCEVRSSCDYFVLRDIALKSPLSVFNYGLYLFAKEFSTDYKEPEILFCDEAHRIPGHLEGHVAAKVTDKVIAQKGWRRPFIPFKASDEVQVMAMSDWAEEHIVYLEEELQKKRQWVLAVAGNAGDRIKGSQQDYKAAMRSYSKAKDLFRHLTLIIRAGQDVENGLPWTWTRPPDADGKSLGYHELRPVYISNYTEYIFGDIPKIVLMSATISEIDLERMGIDSYDIIDVGSVYEDRRTPVYYRPIAQLTKANEETALPLIVQEIDNIIDGHTDPTLVRKPHKGIIHTVSYQRAMEIKKRSRHSDLIMTHTVDDKDEVIGKFKESEEARVLMSPSVMEGEDFPYDQCRFVIVPKVPYPYLGDKTIKRRTDEDPEWYNWKALSDLIQSSGRGMRNENDYCSIYILDSKFEELIKYMKNNSLDIPEWFKNRIQYLDINNL